MLIAVTSKNRYEQLELGNERSLRAHVQERKSGGLYNTWNVIPQQIVRAAVCSIRKFKSDENHNSTCKLYLPKETVNITQKIVTQIKIEKTYHINSNIERSIRCRACI